MYSRRIRKIELSGNDVLLEIAAVVRVLQFLLDRLGIVVSAIV